MRALSVTRPPAAAGVEWIRIGIRLFKPAAIPWMGMSAAFLLVIMGLGMLPVVGALLVQLLTPFMVAAYMAAAEAAEGGAPTGLVHVGAGFYRGRNALLILGLVQLAAGLLVGLVVSAIGGEAIHTLMEQLTHPEALDAQTLRTALDQATPALLLGSALLTPVFMATWFAPALALFDDFPANKAMLWSLWACLVNWRPFLVYALLLTLMLMVAVLIPFGLGLLLFVPIAMTSTYAAYRGQFVPRQGSEDRDQRTEY